MKKMEVFVLSWGYPSHHPVVMDDHGDPPFSETPGNGFSFFIPGPADSVNILVMLGISIFDPYSYYDDRLVKSGYSMIYPLGNCYLTMEHHHFKNFHGKLHYFYGDVP